LIPITELYIASIADVEQINNQLNILPAELEALQQQAGILDLKSGRESTDDLASQLQQTEFILDSLVDDLDRVSTNFTAFEYKLKNIMALKERLEALQAERVDDLTPERIYKLLEKERQKSAQVEKEPNINWQKLQNLKHSFTKRKLALSLAIVATLSLSWAGGYSFAKVQETKDKAVETIGKTDNSAINIGEQKL
jgi:hypothetical protein